MPLSRLSFAYSKPSLCVICLAVAMAKPAFAHTTAFCALLPLPEMMDSKISVASLTVFPPKIDSAVMDFRSKSSGENSNSEWLVAILALFVNESSSYPPKS